MNIMDFFLLKEAAKKKKRKNKLRKQQKVAKKNIANSNQNIENTVNTHIENTSEQPPKTEPKATNNNEPIELNFDEPKTEPKALNKVTGNAEQPPKTEQPPKETNNKGNTNGNNANINNNGNNGNNGNTPKPEPEVKTNPVEESFLKKHWGKIGLGVGALGAIGYGAYKYKQNKNNER